MKENKHTPGPWTVEYCLDGSAFIYAGERPVTMVQSENDEGLTQEDEANCELMASAPSLKAENERLREALKKILSLKKELGKSQPYIDEILSITETALK